MKRMLSLGLVAVLTACGESGGSEGPRGPSGAAGPRGEKGDPGAGVAAPASIAAVTPAVVVAGQTLDVAIIGVATEWTNGALVSFGDGIVVTKVLCPSPQSLIVSLVADAAAVAGTRNVTVTQNGNATRWNDVFKILPRYRVEVLGKPGRGALALVRIFSHDPDFTFDTSWNGTSYIGIRASVSPASVVVVQDVKPRQLDLLIPGDIEAPLGKRDLRVINQYGRPSERSLSFPQLFEFAELSQQVVDAGTPITGTFADAFGSAQFKYQGVASSTEVMASVTSTGGAGAPVGNPMLAVLNNLGKFTATVPLTNSYMFLPTATPVYFVVFDPSGAGGFDYTFTVAPVSRSAETEPNDSKETAPILEVPWLVNAGFASGVDVDFFKIVVTQTELGRHLRVRTRLGQAGQSYTDSKVELFAPDGTLFGASLDLSYHEELRTDALKVTGEWLVKVSYGTYYPPWNTTKSLYELVVNWE